jgi:hypothetical protein
MRRSSQVPLQAGDLLLEPASLVAMAVLVVNDHILKGVGPAQLTGLLSGIAGLVLMPALLTAGAEMVTSLRGRWRKPELRPMLVACLLVGAAYAAVELFPFATETYRWTWGALQWPVASILAVVEGGAVPGIVSVQAVADPWDLLALPALAVPLLVQARRVTAASGTLPLHSSRAAHG